MGKYNIPGYIYIYIYNIVWKNALHNYIVARVLVPFTRKISRWRAILTEYHDRQLLDFLEFGFPAD